MRGHRPADGRERERERETEGVIEMEKGRSDLFVLDSGISGTFLSE